MNRFSDLAGSAATIVPSAGFTEVAWRNGMRCKRGLGRPRGQWYSPRSYLPNRLTQLLPPPVAATRSRTSRG